MMQFLPTPIIGFCTISFTIVHTLSIFIIVFLIAIFKFLSPIKSIRIIFDKLLLIAASAWIICNTINIKLFTKLKLEVSGLSKLEKNKRYLIISNHRSWVDIVSIQMILLTKIPFMKFFLKKELIWVPMLGFAWWALDFPFMKRYSKDFLKKHPHLKGKDLEITKKACRKFKSIPVSVVNFVEGTRFTEKKHKKQNSPYKHLLKPKAGGVAFVLGAMGDYLDEIINITVVYPKEKPYFFHLFLSKLSIIKIKIEVVPINKELMGDYYNDSEYQEHFHEWMNTLWYNKDKLIEDMLSATQK